MVRRRTTADSDQCASVTKRARYPSARSAGSVYKPILIVLIAALCAVTFIKFAEDARGPAPASSPTRAIPTPISTSRPATANPRPSVPVEPTTAANESARLAVESNPPTLDDSPAALAGAIRAGSLSEVINALHEASDDAISGPFNGMTPLMLAAQYGREEIMALLIERGADPNRRGGGERTALQYATEKNRIAIAKRLLDAGADINGYDSTRLTPVTMAADRRYTDLALLFIGRGADVNVQHTQGWTPLIDAARNGDLRLVKALLDAGADLSLRHPSGGTALDHAKRYKHQAIARLLETR